MTMLAEEDLTFKIRGCVFEVFRELGAGYLEKVYENALLIELRNAGLHAASQVPSVVHYKGQEVGNYMADIVVENRVLLEIKAIAALAREHEAQILNYLKATGLKVGLLINFSSPKAQVKRFVL
jgi:GxxExxY protein